MPNQLEEAHELLVDYAMGNDDINSDRLAEISDIFAMLEVILSDADETEECVLAQRCARSAAQLLDSSKCIDYGDLKFDIRLTIDGLESYKSKI